MMPQITKIGPIILDLQGVVLEDEEKELLQHPQTGGVILFTRNYDNPEQLQQLIGDIRACRDPLLIGVDQEGGRVQRFKSGFSVLPPLALFGQEYEKFPKQAREHAKSSGLLMATEMISIGVDFSFAPVLDLNCGMNSVIGDRSFHHHPMVVLDLADAYIDGMHQAGMAAVAKHFPGHGHVTQDSHVALPIDDRGLQRIEETDMFPFIQLLDQVEAIMPAHIIYPQVDQLPTTFSKVWLQDILRERLGYKGAVISDDLSMAGAKMGDTPIDAAHKALEAGCDMLLSCNQRQQTVAILESLSHYSAQDSQGRLLRLQRCHHRRDPSRCSG